MKSDFQRNVERMLGAIRYGNPADAFTFTQIVAHAIYARQPNLRCAAESVLNLEIPPLSSCCHAPVDRGDDDVCTKCWHPCAYAQVNQ